ncbi:MAG: GPW/gp25 family protein [Desulfatiglandaceae bacterium]
MKAPLYRAWRFVHPDFDIEQSRAGIQISSTGGIQMVAEQAAVRQSILLLLTTAPGERVMRPNYGCDLQKLVFSPNDATTHGLAIYYVRRALQRWEPRIDILRLDAEADGKDPGRMDIVLEYRVRKTAQRENLIISVPLTEEVR